MNYHILASEVDTSKTAIAKAVAETTEIMFDFSEPYHPKDAEVNESEDAPLYVDCELVAVKQRDYASIVSAIVRAKYDANQVEAIVLNGNDTEAHAAQLAELQAWRSHAKEIAHYLVG